MGVPMWKQYVVFCFLVLRTVNAHLRLGGPSLLKISTNRTPGILKNIPAFRKASSNNDRTVQEVRIRKLASDWLSKSTPQTIVPDPRPRRPNLRQGLLQAQEELKTLKDELRFLKEQIAKLLGEQFEQSDDTDSTLEARRREFAKIARQTEQWAEQLLFGSQSDSSWTEVQCNKMMRSKFNADKLTTVYLKYMKDTRPDRNIDDEDDDSEWPCIRMYTTIEAPIDEVCLYLSKPENTESYNTLITEHKDLEEISANSKICFAQTPQILFVKPRDFITFCSYRWRNDGTQVLVNQACNKYQDKTATAFALRGATFVKPHPDDPDKTQIAILAHASPGKNMPDWACKTAVKSLMPIEPYKLFWRINESIKTARPELQEILQSQTEFVTNPSHAPAGIASLGFACFWPNGRRELESDDSNNNSGEDRPTKRRKRETTVEPAPALQLENW